MPAKAGIPPSPLRLGAATQNNRPAREGGHPAIGGQCPTRKSRSDVRIGAAALADALRLSALRLNNRHAREGGHPPSTRAMKSPAAENRRD